VRATILWPTPSTRGRSQQLSSWFFRSISIFLRNGRWLAWSLTPPQRSPAATSPRRPWSCARKVLQWCIGAVYRRPNDGSVQDRSRPEDSPMNQKFPRLFDFWVGSCHRTLLSCGRCFYQVPMPEVNRRRALSHLPSIHCRKRSQPGNDRDWHIQGRERGRRAGRSPTSTAVIPLSLPSTRPTTTWAVGITRVSSGRSTLDPCGVSPAGADATKQRSVTARQGVGRNGYQTVPGQSR